MKIVYWCLALVLLASCGSSEKLPKSQRRVFAPPGTVEIRSNFYCDQTELSNISYNEYLYWLSRVYGKESLKYQEALPDTSVWLFDSTEANNYLFTEYFSHPAYNYFPVVGVNKQQAGAYSKWRTDRVVELLLISEEAIDRIDTSLAENYFSVERFYNTLSQSDPLRKRLIPVYRLPKFSEHARLTAFEEANSLKRNRFNGFTSEQLQEVFPTLQENHGHSNKLRNCNRIHHINSNVLELYEDIIIGQLGSPIDSVRLNSDYNREVNAWTGFRNVCEWITVNEYLESFNQQ